MNIRIIVTLLGLVIMSGCAAKSIYQWDDYSGTLYDYTKEPSVGTLAKHQATLIKIVGKASSNESRVPPGIYFELAMIEAELGNTERSLELLDMEQTAFPEAKKYVNLAKRQMESE
jgi:hypothetical protein